MHAPARRPWTENDTGNKRVIPPLISLAISHSSLGSSTTSLRYFSLTTNQPPATSTLLSEQTSTSHQPTSTRWSHPPRARLVACTRLDQAGAGAGRTDGSFAFRIAWIIVSSKFTSPQFQHTYISTHTQLTVQLHANAPQFRSRNSEKRNGKLITQAAGTWSDGAMHILLHCIDSFLKR
jgi:hypothetical protein